MRNDLALLIPQYQAKRKDIYGNYVATKYFNSKWERDNYVKNAAGLNVVECLKPEQEFLHYMFDENVLESDFNKQKLRIQSIDIETEISDQFMPPSRAENRINMITIFDNFTYIPTRQITIKIITIIKHIFHIFNFAHIPFT